MLQRTDLGKEKEEYVAVLKREKMEQGRSEGGNLRRRFSVTTAAHDAGATGSGRRPRHVEPESAACQEGGFQPQTALPANVELFSPQL